MHEQPTPSTERPVAEELADLRRELAAVHARLDRSTRRPRLRGRLARLLPLGIVALMVALVPLATLAANPFTDLNANSPHNGNIDLIFNAGITTGCEPGARYCPNGNVTREEMASFLARTAGLGTNAPVVNAKSLGGVAAANYVQTNSSPTLANLTVNGTIKKAYTPGTSNLATPIAFGYVSAAGALISGTPNVTVAYDGSSRYEIAIAGESFVYNQYQAIVTPTLSNPNQPHLVNTTDDGAGKLVVYVYDSFAGNKVQGAFQFAIFKP